MAADERVIIRNYEGGHMMYLYQPSLEALSDDIVDFINLMLFMLRILGRRD